MGVVGMVLGFMLEEEHNALLLPPAVEAAEKSDVAIVFVGHSPSWETGGTDRESMALPRDGSQDALISAVASVNTNTIVVNTTGSPISMSWLSEVAAVLQAWLQGQEAGYAITDVLLGAVSPGGKLPCTFPKSIEVAPTYGNFPSDLERRRVEYQEGVFVGYRYYDEHPNAVMFPFGYGLSYTTFEITEGRLSGQTLDENGSVTVTAIVTYMLD